MSFSMKTRIKKAIEGNQIRELSVIRHNLEFVLKMTPSDVKKLFIRVSNSETTEEILKKIDKFESED